MAVQGPNWRHWPNQGIGLKRRESRAPRRRLGVVFAGANLHTRWDTTDRPDRFEAIHSSNVACVSALKRRETLNLVRPAPESSGTPLPGRRHALRALRVETPMRAMYVHRRMSSHLDSHAQVGSGASLCVRLPRTRGRRMSGLLLWRGPATTSASCSSISAIFSSPLIRQNCSKL